MDHPQRRGFSIGSLVVSTMLLLACVEAAPVTESTPDSWGLEIQQRFASDQLALAHVYAMAIGPGGVIAVADGPPSRILLLKPDGSAVPIGGQGRGPAEYTYVSQVGFTGDTLWAADPQDAKGMLFGLDGGFIGSETVTVPPSGRYSRAMGPVLRSPDGSWILSERGLCITCVLNGWATAQFFLRSTGAGVIDTVFVLPLAKAEFFRARVGEQAAVEGVHPVPQRPLVVPDLVASGLWVIDRAAAVNGDSASYWIRRISLEGDTIWSASLRYQPQVISDEWKAAWYASRAASIAGFMGATSARMEASVREAVSLPPYFPPISDAIAGRDGRLWLREWHADTLRSEWAVLDSLGHLEGHVTAPAGFRILAADSSQVWGIIKDSLDVEAVVRAQITRRLLKLGTT